MSQYTLEDITIPKLWDVIELYTTDEEPCDPCLYDLTFTYTEFEGQELV